MTLLVPKHRWAVVAWAAVAWAAAEVEEEDVEEAVALADVSNSQFLGLP
jgi:hypothetical protein